MFESATKKRATVPDIHPKKDDLKTIKHSEEIFTSSSIRDGEPTTLYTQQMFPLDKDYSCIVVFLHGLAAYSSREFPFMLHLVNKLDACVCSIDHIGHGFSDGLPGFVDDTKLCVQDIIEYSQDCKKKYVKKDMKMFLVGYSMGGLLNLQTIRKSKDLFDGTILIGPLISPKEKPNGFVTTIAHMINFVSPTYPLIPFSDNATQIKEVHEEFHRDEHNYTGSMRIGTGLALQEGFLDLEKNLHEIDLPLFIVFGDKDFVCDIEGAKLLMKKSIS
eukprot:gene6723-10888_t